MLLAAATTRRRRAAVCHALHPLCGAGRDAAGLPVPARPARPGAPSRPRRRHEPVTTSAATTHHAGDHDADHDTQASWFVGLLTFRTVVAALTFFGLAGLAAAASGLEPPGPRWPSPWPPGAGALFLVAWLMRSLHRLSADGTVRIERAVGQTGTVYLSIPGHKAGAGKVHAQLAEPHRGIPGRHRRTQTLPTGTPVVVVAVVSADTVEVAPATHSREDQPMFNLSCSPADRLAGLPWLAVLAVAVVVVFLSFAHAAGQAATSAARATACWSSTARSAAATPSRCIHGGAAFVLPLIQDYAYLSLEPIQIEVPLKGALSIENIRVNVPSVFTVAIGTDPEIDAERGHPPAGPEHRRDQAAGRATSSSASCGR